MAISDLPLRVGPDRMETGPEVEMHGHRHTGRPVVDLVLGVSAIMISLGLAILHGNAMERLVEANSWPFVATGVSTADPDGTDHFRLVMMNKGIGPALIRSLEVFDGDRAIPNGRALLRAIPPPTSSAAVLLTSTVVDNVLSARETIDFVDVPTHGATAAQQRALLNVAQRLSVPATAPCSTNAGRWTPAGRPFAPTPRNHVRCQGRPSRDHRPPRRNSR